MKNVFTKTLLSSALMLAASGASAAAFQLAEVSSSGLGRAYAGEAAIADNAAVIATNPALMSKFDRSQFSAGGVYVASRIHMDGEVSASVSPQLGGLNLDRASANKQSVVPGSFVPNMYFVAPINEKFAVGTGMNVNFGLKSQYGDDYAAGVFGGETDLTALNLNFSGSYKVTEGLSAGLGLNAIYASAKVKRTAGIIDSALGRLVNLHVLQQPTQGALDAASSSIQNDTTIVHLQDKAAWAFGWNAGLVYEFNENNRIGLAYHSKVDIDFKDNTALSYQPYGVKAHTASGGLTLKLPDYWELSGYHKLTDKFALHYSYKYTRWSRLQKLHAVYDSAVTVPLTTGGTEQRNVAFEKAENYKNSSRYAIGATYDINDKLTVRAGIAYDKSAAPKEHSSASIPDTDRKWFSLGATYRVNNDLSLDFGFAHLRGKKVHFSEEQSLANGAIVVKGNYTSHATANLYGLNLNYSF